MPTTIIQIVEAKRVKNNITLTAKQGDNVITREIDVSEFDTWQKFAQWVINQAPDFVLLPDKQKTLTITFHNETQEGVIVRIVDNVVIT